MTENTYSRLPARRILIATDLSSRGDRALDRALRLSREWSAELHLVHVVRPLPPAPMGMDPAVYFQRLPSPKDQAWRLLRRDVLPTAPNVRVHLEEQDASPASVILAVAEREGCDLIVMGISRQRLTVAERTVEHVVRKSRCSVLVVKSRPHSGYNQLMVGSDFTDEAGQALVAAATLFPDAPIVLVHAYMMPYEALLQSSMGAQEMTAGKRLGLQEHLAAAQLPESRKATIRVLVEPGPPGPTLRGQASVDEVDLTVIGAHPRGVLFDSVIGQSRQIIESVPSDLMVVRAIRADAG